MKIYYVSHDGTDKLPTISVQMTTDQNNLTKYVLYTISLKKRITILIFFFNTILQFFLNNLNFNNNISA